MTLSYKTVALDLDAKAAPKAGSGEFVGYGAVFGNVDAYGDIIEPGAFVASIRAHQAAGTWPAMLFNHSHMSPVGDWLEMSEDSKGLYVKGRLWIDGDMPDPDACKVYRVMQSPAGGKMGLSIGYRTKASVDRNDGVRLLTEIELYEVSPVMFPANPKARVEAVKSEIATIRDFERWLREAGGYSAAEAKRIAAHGFKALSDPTHRDGSADERGDPGTGPRDEDDVDGLVAAIRRNIANATLFTGA